MRTVYVFGAGASLEVGYPLASRMGSGLLAFMAAFDDPRVKDAGDVLRDMFGDTPDIEELITEIDLRIREEESRLTDVQRRERAVLGDARGWIGFALQQWFRRVRSNPAPSYAALSERIVRAGDCIITFNYDDSLENELKRVGMWDLSQGYGFSLGESDRISYVRVLKLHGSINWLVSLFGGTTSGTFAVGPNESMGLHPVIAETDFKFLGYKEFSGHTFKGGAAFPCLIMPGRRKEFFYDTSLGREYERFWDGLWGTAREALRECDRLIICGYSLLPVDQRACDLLLKSPKKSIPVEIISGSQTERIAQDFASAGFADVRAFRGGYFSEWVGLQP